MLIVIHWVERMALRVLALLLLVLLLLQAAGCTPHEELRSPCHMASGHGAPDCEFTPISGGLG